MKAIMKCASEKPCACATLLSSPVLKNHLLGDAPQLAVEVEGVRFTPTEGPKIER